MSKTRTRAAATVLSLSALAPAACHDPPTAPSAVPAVAVARAGPELISNHKKYRDRGHRPGTGRSGSAVLTVSALRGKTGVTDVIVAAGWAAGGPSPTLMKVRVEGSTPGGELLFRELYAPPAGVSVATFPIAGLARNDIVGVDAHARNAGRPPRVFVIDVTDTVKLRPDLVVDGLQAPSVGWVHTPVVIGAALSEINGDVGARTNCVLDVDGAPVDSAVGVWVDAGGTVSCAFAYTFQTLGAHAIRVRAAAVDPGDYDEANNAATGAIEIRRDVGLAYEASAQMDSTVRLERRREEFSATPGWTYRRWWFDSSGTAGARQSSAFYGYTREQVEFPEQPLRDARLAQWTGGAVVHEATYDVLPADSAYVSPDSSSGCVSRSDGEIVATFILCSVRTTRDGVVSSYTSVDYRWNAGDVTYLSRGYVEVVCSPRPFPICQNDFYSWNSTTRSVQGRRVLFGTEFAYDVRFRSGFTTFSAAPVLPIEMTYSKTGTPYSCGSSYGYYPPIGALGFITVCYGVSDERWRWAGSASGGP